MKEQILHLDPHDDFISARDKMGWTQTQRVLLVWPAQGRVLTRRLDLVLLHRHAHMLGAHMALVTGDEDVRDHARELGLPAFYSIEESRGQRWRSRLPPIRPERLRPPPDREAFKPSPPLVKVPELSYATQLTLRSAALALGIAALIALWFALVPAATITLTPAARPVSASVNLVADPRVSEPLGSLIPARAVRVEVEASGFVATTGLKDVPSEKAAGVVVFTNLVGTPVTIPQGTGVRTTGGTAVRFTTSQAVTIEGRVGAAAQAPVTAVEPGPDGNVAAAQINAIDGPLGLQLAATNPRPMQGGAVAPRAAVTVADRIRIHDQLLTQLQQTALGALDGQLQPGEFLAGSSIQVAETVLETYDHVPDEVADTVGLTLRIAVTGLALSERDVQQAAQTAIVAQVAKGETLVANSLRIERSPENTLDADGRVHFAATASGSSAPQIESDSVRRLTAGRTIQSARARLLAALPLAESPRIEVSPRWYGRLPFMLFRIKVAVP